MNNLIYNNNHIILKSIENFDRIIIIGDIHGEYETLSNMLSMLSFDSNDLLLLVGDLINKGPESHNVLKYIYNDSYLSYNNNNNIQNYNKNTHLHNIYSCKGNHEIKLINEYIKWKLLNNLDLEYIENFLNLYYSNEWINEYFQYLKNNNNNNNNRENDEKEENDDNNDEENIIYPHIHTQSIFHYIQTHPLNINTHINKSKLKYKGRKDLRLTLYQLTDIDIIYLISLPLSIYIEDINILILHAGVTYPTIHKDFNFIDLKCMSLFDITNVRNVNIQDNNNINNNNINNNNNNNNEIHLNMNNNNNNNNINESTFNMMKIENSFENNYEKIYSYNTQMEYIYNDNIKYIGTKFIDEGIPWTELYEGPIHIYFGHDSKKGIQLKPYITGLDTGCCKGLYLTACILTKIYHNNNNNDNNNYYTNKNEINFDNSNDLYNIINQYNNIYYNNTTNNKYSDLYNIKKEIITIRNNQVRINKHQSKKFININELIQINLINNYK